LIKKQFNPIFYHRRQGNAISRFSGWLKGWLVTLSLYRARPDPFMMTVFVLISSSSFLQKQDKDTI
jgi:hypothetical protein